MGCHERVCEPFPHDSGCVRPLAFDDDVVQGQDIAPRGAVARRMPIDSGVGVSLIRDRDDISNGHAVIAGSDIETPDAIFDLRALNSNIEGIPYADIGAAGFAAIAVDRHVVDVLITRGLVRDSDDHAVGSAVRTVDVARLRTIARQPDEAFVEP
jgi:hypothetical protein